ncbi:substrate-binding domain-containing protein [Natronobiforma cellulositropha]
MAAALAGCLALDDGDDTERPALSGETLRLTTTTSTYDTGLLDDLNAPFEARYGVTVETVGLGTAAALETARSGDADVVLVHARSLEDEFLREGYGVNRRDLMFNDFVIVGDPDDPAGVGATEDALEAFERIADAEATFVSRGDNSGTHTKELEIWAATAVGDERGEWYREAGDGMGMILNQANQSGGYTLSDRGTYLSMRETLDLEILLEGPIEDGPDRLANPYGIVAVNPAVYDHVEYDLAMAYIGYLTGPEGHDRIESYTANGEQLFFPEALSADPNFEQYVPADWSRAGND